MRGFGRGCYYVAAWPPQLQMETRPAPATSSPRASVAGSWHRRSSTSETFGGQGRSLHEQLGTSQSQTSTSHPPRKRCSGSHCTVVRHADPCSHDRPPFPPKPHQILTTLKPIIPTRAESWRKPRQTLLHPIHFPHVPKHTLDFCWLREKGARMVRRQKKKKLPTPGNRHPIYF